MVSSSYNVTLPGHTEPHEDFKKSNARGLPGPKEFQTEQNETTKSQQRNYPYTELFRYSTIWDRLLIVLGVISASLASICVPYNVIIYAEFTTLLIDRDVGTGTSTPAPILNIFGGGKRLTNASRAENMQAVKDDALAFAYGTCTGSLVQLLLLGLAVNLLNKAALKQIAKIRKLFLKAILRQDMSWYDTSSGNTFANKMTEDLDKMKEGIAEKVAMFVFLIMTFVAGCIFSFIYGWLLTLVVFTCCPFIIISTALVAKIQGTFTEKELQAYSNAGAVAEEVFSGIRTVFAFSGERKETERFAKLLVPAEKTGCKKGLYSGIGSGIMWFIIYVAYAIATWYGIQLILKYRYMDDKVYTAGSLVVVLFSIIMGAQNLGFSLPYVEAFATAKGAAQNIFSIIDRISAIDPLNENGAKLESVTGNISFENLHFRYPARSDVQVLKGFSLQVRAGQTVALVGPSGCGKSTTLQLLQRFYDAPQGCVRLDGRDLRELNVSWLRSQIGVVGQEPVLFGTTIAENIRYGKPSATQEEIEKAARMANCHDFIVKLPSGYNTMVGERGAQMSGGQKQRIAIARALIRNPKILLLDEATSALDPTSERRVQDALDVASQGRTTLVVSHRLSTVTNADMIVFVKDGVVAEQGTHEELMRTGGLYCKLVMISKRQEEEEALANTSNAVRQRKQHLQVKNNSSDEGDSSFDEADAESVVSKKKSKRSKPKAEKNKITFLQLMKMNAPEWRYILTGCIAAMMHGATFPTWAVLFGDFFGALSDPDDDYITRQSILLAILFLVIGVITGIGSLLQTYMFNTAGVKMTSRLRLDAFNAIIRQEVAYFDDQRNSVGALCARLAGDCSNVQGATGSRIGIIVQAMSTLTIGVILAFTYSWKLTLVTLVTLPLVCAAILFETRFMEASTNKERQAIEDASRLAVEAIANIRTVTSLGQERYVLERYDEQINRADKACRKKLRYRGLVYGLGQTAPFMAYGVSLGYGGFLVANQEVPYQDIIKVSEGLIFGSWMLGQALSYAPNVGDAVLSAARLLKLFQRTPTMYNPVDKPYNTAVKFEGDITYENVNFNYPNRKGINILQNLNLTIKGGTTVALVGPSGSGKSTCVQLLLRYYDPVRGGINLSGVPTTEFPFDTLRSGMGLVSQEPVLFDRTIAENIAYGDNFRTDIPMAEIIEAAKKSNIHQFITSLPQGYNTSLGSKGAQLSGGQKQRIAIARAMVRNPKILILDEATSALDMESEKVVQEALDTARSGRTCVTIAHRLTTVRDADLICVLKKGVVVEKGSHEELMALNGIYAELYMMQQVA
ncbi:multidrug resistance protein homolog 49 [Ceratitis capitata]|nr:multidrug resistance protein homolog 49 [Ceratitis capitata]XP_004537390.1 multidrug resistance protein homolog 49 [Ceratitis capitata]XP_012162142.1 multidrug resistance protein homolog 49 [Ceratitis capitata]XP_020717748.1 multidrug resistance protein homolog 49 [Ceratitis capitata]XP_020717749.1 multidrug resistance protein homolog 49 [Ceratitis capitata]